MAVSTPAGSSAGGRPGMPSGTAAVLGSSGSMAGFQSSLPLQGAAAAPAFDGTASLRDFRWPPAPPSGGASALGGVPGASGSLEAAPMGSAPLGSSSLYGGYGGLGLYPSGTQPSASAASASAYAAGLPVTPAYERAAAALSAQVASGASFALNVDGEGGMAGMPDSMFPNALSPPTESYLEPAGNHEVTIQTLQSLQANAGVGAAGGLSAPKSSQYTSLTLPANAGSGPAGLDDYGPSQAYAGRGSPGAACEETVSALQGNSFQQYGKTMDLAPAGPPDGLSHGGALGSTTYGASNGSTAPPVIDGTVYGSSSPAALDGARYGSSYSSGSPAAFDARRAPHTVQRKQELDKFSFPTAGSFVATPYDGEGLPTYYGNDAPLPSAPPRSYDSVQGARKAYYDEGDARRSAMGIATGCRYDGGDAGRSAMGVAASYALGGGGAADFGINPEYGSALPYSGVPPAGRVSHASIAAPAVSGPPAGSFAIATSGSFVASPFAEGAPALDVVPPAAASYAPPPVSFGGPGLPASGSFVASPFAEGAPTPDMLGMRMRQRPQGGYPDYASLPPSSFGMYGGVSPGVGFGGSPFSYGQSPFVGFDAEVPGKPMGTANFGVESASSFVTNEGGTGSSGMKSGEKYNEPLAKGAPQGKASREQEVPEDPNSKACMQRGPRERDGAAPRTKRKTERRACC